MKRKFLSLLLALVMIAFPVFATTYTLTSEEIELRCFSSIAEALASLPGIDIQDYYGNSALVSVSINGSKGSQVDVYVDGIRQSRDYDGSFNLGMLSIHNVDHIEVTGSVGIGGIVRIYTKNSGEVSIYNRSLLSESEASATDRIFTSQDVSASYKFNIADGQSVKTAISFSHDATAHRQTAEYNKLPVCNLDSLVAYNGSFDKLGLGFNAHYSYNYADTIGSTTWVSHTLTKTQNLDLSFSGSYKADFGKLDLNLGYKGKYYNYKPFVESIWDPENDTKTHDISADVSLVGKLYGFDYEVYVPVDFVHVISTSGTGIDKNRIAAGLGIKVSKSINQFDFSIDTKAPFTKATEWHVTGEVDWHADEKTQTVVFVSGGYSTAVPNMSALYWPKDYTMYYEGNPNLKNERGWNLDIGVSSKPISGLNYRGSVFLRRTYDLIATVMDPDTWMYYPVNIDQALFIGSDQALSAVIVDHIKLEANATINYTYNLSGDNSIADKIRINNVRMHTLKLVTGYVSKNLDVLFDAQFLGGYYYNNTKQHADTIMGVTVNYRPLDDVAISAKLSNLTNTDYFLYEGYPMPGISLTIGGSYKF